jgi:hypothetical protein
MKVLALALGSVLALGLIGCQSEPRSDAEITADVKQELTREGVPGTIDVMTMNRVVTLSGNVPNAAAKEDAEDAAEEVDGIERVVNNLTTPGSMAGDAPAAGRPAPPPIVDPHAPSAPEIH